MPSVTFIPAKPHFHVKRDVFVQIVDSIPPGKLTTPEAIIAFLSDLYGEECISIPDFVYTRIDESLAGVEHNWWRLVSPRGLIQEIRHFPYSIDTRKRLLEEEGHTVIPTHTNVSFQVLNFKTSLHDLNELRSTMPTKDAANYYPIAFPKT